MASNNTFKIASHFTNVDLAQGLTTNLAEIELALKLNPGQFTNLMLFDQGKGSAFKTTAFPTDWDGSRNYYGNGFGQDIWKTTGLGFIQSSNLWQSFAEATLELAKSQKEFYPYYLRYLLNRTGSSYSMEDLSLGKLGWIENIIKTYKLPEFDLGISTKFDILSEVQTGSPVAVDLLLNQSNTSTYFSSNPHAYFISNHGGSYLLGGNADGPANDLDPISRYLQVTEFANSIETAIQTYSKNNTLLGLVAYDE